MRGSLVKLNQAQWHTWTFGGVVHWVRYWSQKRTIGWLRIQHQIVLEMFLGFRKPLYSCSEGMCHYSTSLGMSLHASQFYQAFPRVSAASDKCWGIRLFLSYIQSFGEKLGRKTCEDWPGISDTVSMRGLLYHLNSWTLRNQGSQGGVKWLHLMQDWVPQHWTYHHSPGEQKQTQ